MRYEDAFTYLNSLDAESEAVNSGGQGFARLLAAFDNPHHKIPSIVVAGTNGQGSTCAMLSRVLRQAGLRVGMFTSPHSLTIEERIRINGELVSAAKFSGIVLEIRDKAEKLFAAKLLQTPPTLFEAVAAAAFLHFARSRPDFLVLEAGMGGRFDPLNIVTPKLTIITSICHDHLQYSGETLTTIAEEKAEIIKAGGRVLTSSDQEPEVMEVVSRRAAEKNAVLETVPPVPITGRNEFGNLLVQINGRQTTLPWPNPVQARNAGLAAAAARALLENVADVGEAVAGGISQARWPGRTELLRTVPPILLDGAQNSASVQALTDCLRHDIRNRPITLVFGCMRDQPIRELLSYFIPYVSRVILVGIPGNARACAPKELFRTACRLWLGEKVSVEPDFAAGFSRAKAVTPDNGLILVAGSLYLVGEAHRHFNHSK